MAVGLGVASGRCGVAVEHLAELFAFVIGHHRELECDAGDTIDVGHRAADPVLDLVAQGASGDGQRNGDVGGAVVGEFGAAEHAEIDDRTVKLRILDGAEGVDQLGVHLLGHGDHSGGARPGFALSP